VSGTATDLAALAGEWSGEYSSPETGRSGSIVFRLVGGTDSATGDVMMTPQLGTPRGATPSQGAPPVASEGMRAPQVLTIRFVRIQSGRVSGRLDPYVEPDCRCTLLTVFEGELKGDVLAGTYTSRVQTTGQEQHGRWQVKRQKP
jgi:hypothetical protein